MSTQLAEPLRLPRPASREQKRCRVDVSGHAPLSKDTAQALLNDAASKLRDPNLRVERVIVDGLDEKSLNVLLGLLRGRHNLKRKKCPEMKTRVIIECPENTQRNAVAVEHAGKVVNIIVGRRRRQMQTVIERDGHMCVWCSAELTRLSPEATLDHVIPDSKGGPRSIRNSLLACSSCNNKRGNLPALTWYQICRASGRQIREAVLFERLADLLLS